jgi:hypothetical protein
VKVGESIYVERKLGSQSFGALAKSLLLIGIKQQKTPKLRLKSCKQSIERVARRGGCCTTSRKGAVPEAEGRTKGTARMERQAEFLVKKN